ncbi:DUF6586 family protein [Parahaliea mediterranea]|uniref:PasA protein n=1 Tax=Parahaliea mediterranea TaxID=651086 RepID=A0A939INT3_9GAMM|nr:DUF6586 family protein [Parahaliea mediterranea]MBN7798377.1 hypothetical protein [Parahaliea mediterranea]
MSSARGLANHHLYLARLVLDAWGRECEAQQVSAATLSEAFGPACHAHLGRAYGWFLLAVAGAEPLPLEPPSRAADLPPRPAGKAVPGEIREFERLEREGWLAQMLAWAPQRPGQGSAARARQPGNLARPAPSVDGPDTFRGWARDLDSLFQRMGDSLDEY